MSSSVKGNWKAQPWSSQHPMGFLDDLASTASTAQKQPDFTKVVEGQEPWLETITEEFSQQNENEEQDLSAFYVKDKQNKNKKLSIVLETTDKLNVKELKTKSKSQVIKKQKKTLKTKFTKEKDSVKFETACNYIAMDVSGSFGFIETNDSAQGSVVFVAHTRRGKSPSVLLSVRPGDTLNLVTRGGGRGQARVTFTSRSRYVSPGKPVRSMLIGVRRSEWDAIHIQIK